MEGTSTDQTALFRKSSHIGPVGLTRRNIPFVKFVVELPKWVQAV
jgi:hypothetical protein